MDRYICIHGHFYQPPRENAWLEAIEQQDSAYPYHDWNERVSAECYRPNGASRIMDGDGHIVDIVNNYSRISYNFGPTLLSWMEEKDPEAYSKVLAADKESAERFGGHGSAIAQAYGHAILPLCHGRDKYTQILWGVKDFRHRFGRDPEGMWLPEAAVDLETLDILAQLGIKFTVLAPNQARRVRKIGERTWRDITGDKIDPTTAYEIRLPTGRKLSLFFYDGPISRAVAFEKLLSSGEALANRLLGAFSDNGRSWDQLVHIATDGETYGHHQTHGDMALAYAIHHIESNNLAKFTNYGEYLENHRPTHLVEIWENSSWSCVHGVERWKADCGCNSGMKAGWNQKWREPLRNAFDWLRDTLVPLYEEMGDPLFKDPWEARNDYIDVILDRSPESVERFFATHGLPGTKGEERVKALKLLEMQRHALLMYTSCGWFFDELSGIETTQVIQYAARAVQLAQELFGDHLEAQFLDRLARAKSNIPENGDGRTVYEKFVRPAIVDREKVAAHYAISSLFEDYPDESSVYAYAVKREDYKQVEAGKAKLAIGKALFTSRVTTEPFPMTFAVMHMGDHNLNGGVRESQDDQAYEALTREITETFQRGDFPEVVRLMDRHFGESTYSLRSLFRDEQRKVLDVIMRSALDNIETLHRQGYDQHAPFMRYIISLGVPLPPTFCNDATAVLNADLRRAFQQPVPDLERVRALLEQARALDIDLDKDGLAFVLRQTVEKLALLAHDDPGNVDKLRDWAAVVDLATSLPFSVNLWRVQNIFYDSLKTAYAEKRAQADQGDAAAKTWVETFGGLGDKLRVKV